MYLDAGTTNEQNLHDPLYLGMRKARPVPRGALFLCRQVRRSGAAGLPEVLHSFRGWAGADAVHLLQRYRDKYCVYNDEVQGAAGIVLAGMINAAKIQGMKLSDEKYLFLGAGSAGIGLADLICSAMVQEGLPLKQAQTRASMFDINQWPA
jgi:malate dehydrogenase (oxaloacetate-decarboxylating)(NADP+)